MANGVQQILRHLAWDDLRFFLAVCRRQTVSGAAHLLGVDHATVSRRIARLEQFLNAKLFEHHKSGYVPTSAGARLLDMVEHIEVSIVTCQAEISDSNQNLDGMVRVGAPDGFGSSFLSPRLADFCLRNSKLAVDLIATSRSFNLAQREIDIAISLALPKEGRIVGRKLVDYDLGAFASDAYLARHPTIRTRKDLREHQIIGYVEEDTMSPLLNYTSFLTKDVSPRFRSTNLIAQAEAVRQGRGIAILPKFVAGQIVGIRQVLKAEVKLTRTFYMLIHEDNRKLARIEAVANFIHQQVREEAALFAEIPPSSADTSTDVAELENV